MKIFTPGFLAGAYQAAKRALFAFSGVSELGVQILENEVQSRHPRRPEEPATSRLSRGEIVGTIVREKLQNRMTFVRIGVGTPATFLSLLTRVALEAAERYAPTIGKMFTKRLKSTTSWSEPPTPYAPVYPYNNVTETESGHVMEFDDTPGFERVHVAHRSGTFHEMHPDGTYVDKVVKDRYTITMGDGHVAISGDCHVHVEGNNVSLFVKGNCDLEVKGGLAVNATENIKMFSKNIEFHALRQFKVSAPIVDLFYIKMPSGLKPTYGVTAISGTPGSPVSPGSGGVAVVPAVEFPIRWDEAAEQIVGLDEVMPQVEVMGEIPLEEPKFYKDTTPIAKDQRARMFDSPSETQTLDAYTSHMQLALSLADFAIESKRIAGNIRDIDDTLPSYPEPSTVVDYFVNYKNTFTYLADTLISSRYHLKDLLPPDTRYAIPSETADVIAQNGLLEDELVYNLSLVATNILDPIRDQYPDVEIVEGLRVQHTGQSQHELGQAVDIRFPTLESDELLERAQWIRDNVPYDELVLNWTNVADEPWIHVSFDEDQRRRAVYTKDFMDQFHDGLMVVEDYASESDRLVALEESTAEAEELLVAMQAEHDREALRTPITAADPGTTGGIEASDGTIVRGYDPLWDAAGPSIMLRVASMATDHPTEFAAVASGNTAFIALLVTQLRSEGFPCGLNGRHGSLATTESDVLVFANGTGCGDGSGIYDGLEVYRVVSDGAASFTDLTPDLIVSGNIGAWIDPA